MGQISAMNGKSTSKTTTRTSTFVSFTNDTMQNTPRYSPSTSNISTPLTDSPTFCHSIKGVKKVFNKNLMASLTSKNAVFKEVRDCIIRSEEERLKQLNPYLHSYYRDLHISNDSVFMDEKVFIPNALKKTLIEDLHASHRGSCGMLCMAQHCWWPFMNGDLLARSIECKPFTTINKI